ncbi:MAG: cytidylate kinase family protein [Oscillospiraceae bacterium]|nr:cytidylate kinase family protein [Oscillospiraceae bacterium]
MRETVRLVYAGDGQTLGYSINEKTVPVQDLRSYIEANGVEDGVVYEPGRNCLQGAGRDMGVRGLDEKYRLSITGELGSGKSSICEKLCGRFGLSVYSAGKIMREMAEKAGVSIERMNKLVAENEDIDKQIDRRMANLSELPGLFVVDARLGWYFVRDTYKIYAYVDRKVGARRVAGDGGRICEVYGDEYKAMEKLGIRQKLEIERFKSIYGVDYLDMRNYDLVIDTTDITSEEAALFVADRYEAGDRGVYLSKYSLYPTRRLGEFDGQKPREQPPGGRALPVVAHCSDNKYYIEDGHRSIAADIQRGKRLIEVKVSDNEAVKKAAPGRADEYKSDWGDALGFRFYS